MAGSFQGGSAPTRLFSLAVFRIGKPDSRSSGRCCRSIVVHLTHALAQPQHNGLRIGEFFTVEAPDETCHVSSQVQLDLPGRRSSIAPYVGWAYHGEYGNSALYQRQAPAITCDSQLVFGLSVWY